MLKIAPHLKKVIDYYLNVKKCAVQVFLLRWPEFDWAGTCLGYGCSDMTALVPRIHLVPLA